LTKQNFSKKKTSAGKKVNTIFSHKMAGDGRRRQVRAQRLLHIKREAKAQPDEFFLVKGRKIF